MPLPLRDFAEPSWTQPALLTIDMQTDFAFPGGSAFVPGTDEILPTLAQLIVAFRRASLPIFHAIRLYLEDGSNAELCRRSLLLSGASIVRPGTAGARPVETILPVFVPGGHEDLLRGQWLNLGPKEWMFYKSRWSAFYGTELEARLQELGVDTLVVAGCNFPNCPSATLFDATERDFRAILADDAVSGVNEAGLAWCRGIGVRPLATRQVEKAILEETI